MLLAAARRDQAVIDASFGDTSAGIFTYVLTRYLWQQTRSNSVNQTIVSATTTDRILEEYFPTAGISQQPEFNVRSGSSNSEKPVYFLEPRINPPAEGVITKVQGEQVDVVLGGIDPPVLEAFGKEEGQVQIPSRDQLTAKGKIIESQGTIGTIEGNLHGFNPPHWFTFFFRK